MIHPPDAKRGWPFLQLKRQNLNHAPPHLSCASLNNPACRSGQRGKWIGTQHFYLASFSPSPSNVTALSTIREDPHRFIALFQGQTQDWQRMIHHAWLVCAAPRPVSISKGRATSKEGDNALVTPPFLFPAHAMENTADVSPRCMRPVSVVQPFIKRSSWEWRETAAALQETCLQWHVCQWWLCVQIGCPIILPSATTSVWTQSQTPGFK